MTGRRFALIVAACLFAVFVASNILVNTWFKGARLDLTQNQLYSLSRGTRDIIRDIAEPVELKFFFSRNAAAADPFTQAYGARVRELLETYAARSNGRVRFVEINPEPFTDAEEEAAQSGIEPLQARTGGDPLYFGLVGSNSVDDTRVIPFFTAEREPFLEYEITRLIYELDNPNLPKIGLITGLPMDPALAQTPFGAQAGQSLFSTELGRLMDVETLDPTFSAIPDDVDVLAIIHPYPLSPEQLFAIDQFILAKGRAFIALDPASLVSLQGGFDPLMGPAMIPPASDLGPLLRAWGVQMAPEVVLDLGGAMPVLAAGPGGQQQQIPRPIFFRIDPPAIDREDLTTAWLQRGLVFGAAGAFDVADIEGVETTTLARTSVDTMRIPAAIAMTRPSPIELLQAWVPANQREIVALRLSGTLPSAYPNGPPDPLPPAEGEPPPTPTPAPGAAPARALQRSATPAQIVLVADTDFLADDFYVAPDQSGATFADNGSFALNAIDILTGSDALVSLRSRAPSLRPMTVLQNLQSQAEQRIQQRYQELQAELQQTEAELARLQQRGQGSNYFRGDLGAELTPEETTELNRFTRRMGEIRQELRYIGRVLRADVDRLEGWVTFVNVWLMPLLVAGAGVFVFWRRQRRNRRSAGPGARA